MELRLIARLDKLQTQAAKDAADDPMTTLTLKATLIPDVVGRLATFIGQDLTITITNAQDDQGVVH